MGIINSKCQVPTPKEIVIQMLDVVGYMDNLYGKRVLENSCGSGSFLVEIVERYIQDCQKNGYTAAQIEAGLQRDIHGIEKDRKLQKLCISNLNQVANSHGLSNIYWDIKRKNALHATKTGRYHFVIGNPPYLAYPELDEVTRGDLRSNFESCMMGKPDYYFAFLETAIKALNAHGKMIYLVPGNFMKNVYAERLRQLLLPSLCEIIDYSHHKLFGTVLTSSVIVYCDRTKTIDTVRYEDRHYHHLHITEKAAMHGKWVFGNQQQDAFVSFSEFFHASAPVATQLNDAFVIKMWEEYDERFILVDDFLVERAVLRDAAGPRALQRNRVEKIIFPYAYGTGGTLMHYSEAIFQERFPGAYRYLWRRKTELCARHSDKNALWFEYGRSQLLTHLNQKKILLSSFVTRAPRTYLLDKSTIPYAGICVIAKDGYAIEQARSLLDSATFMEYVRRIGVCTNGISYRISPTDIDAFSFPRKLMEE